MKFLFPLWLGLAATVVAIDQITKTIIIALFKLGESKAVTPFFDLVYVTNTGAAFSFLRDAGGWQQWLFVSLAFGISGWIIAMLRRHAQEILLSSALTLILGGALGNALDRLLFGAVVDFLDFHWGAMHFPAFNVADSAITLAVALMLWQQFTHKDQR
ncbi:MAG: lipoprotein signal peptidase [Rhodocyclales bacterium]|nr:lipoprotein signal peptidase [Rhodocyclales bacterium]